MLAKQKKLPRGTWPMKVAQRTVSVGTTFVVVIVAVVDVRRVFKPITNKVQLIFKFAKTNC
jgi:hypothetical protein